MVAVAVAKSRRPRDYPDSRGLKGCIVVYSGSVSDNKRN